MIVTQRLEVEERWSDGKVREKAEERGEGGGGRMRSMIIRIPMFQFNYPVSFQIISSFIIYPFKIQPSPW